ncbi:hypothetical protein BS47DRAFT_1340768 [Hydnum rufescens UP504]|uniref:Uncharacterized protein n=1 Tax=Hydnum rufescens UP504 TaxID=1448309 RepID=A0A9P6B2Z2_9AGAM|nr:hypothetical protein BS47DRAFT_1340768 [Hydnum rufescens UP504]
MDPRSADPAFIAQVLLNTFAGLSLQSRSRVSGRTIHTLSVDIYMVAVRIRQACLIEGLTLDANHLDLVISSLRNASSLFQDVFLIYEPSSLQSFILNATVFRKNRGESSAPWTTYVQISEPVRVATPPQGVPILLDHISRHVTEFHGPLPTHLILPSTSLEVMVPLTGYLLEYPVSYIPSMDTSGTTVDGGFLCGVPLSVFRATLVRRSGPNQNKYNPTAFRSQPIIQFSCPAVLNGQVAELDPASILQRIQNRWKKRITGHASSLLWDEIRVSVERKTLDRVVL